MAEAAVSDKGLILILTIKDNKTQAAVNLTGATVLLRWKLGTGAVTESALTITDAVNGVVQYQFSIPFAESGSLQYEAVVNDATGNIYTNLAIQKFAIRAKLA